MNLIDNLAALCPDQIEQIERLTLRWVFQASIDFGMEAYDIFRHSPDEVKDVAEDVTRELLDRLPGYNIPQRIFGTVDYKRARYVILPDMIVRQALFADSKAEKTNQTATIQMSQTSMIVKQYRFENLINEMGKLPSISLYDGMQYLTTTVFLHFTYVDIDEIHHLREATLFCLPNGSLQNIYNPDADDTIWLAGRNAPSLGEDFRVRISFARLKAKAFWRVQKIYYSETLNQCQGVWDE
jgi:hypothetical protein